MILIMLSGRTQNLQAIVAVSQRCLVFGHTFALAEFSKRLVYLRRMNAGLYEIRRWLESNRQFNGWAWFGSFFWH
jgi:hypothetical protein